MTFDEFKNTPVAAMMRGTLPSIRNDEQLQASAEIMVVAYKAYLMGYEHAHGKMSNALLEIYPQNTWYGYEVNDD